MFIMKKQYLVCGKCRAIYHFAIPQSWFMRKVLFFLPVKIYFCAKCNRRRYVWITDAEEAKYEKV